MNLKKSLLAIPVIFLSSWAYASGTNLIKVDITKADLNAYWDEQGMLSHVTARGEAKISEQRENPNAIRTRNAETVSRMKCKISIQGQAVMAIAKKKLEEMGHDVDDGELTLRRDGMSLFWSYREETSVQDDGDTVVTTCTQERSEALSNFDLSNLEVTFEPHQVSTSLESLIRKVDDRRPASQYKPVVHAI